MAIQVASNFMLNSKNFLDARGGFKTIASMKAFPESGIPDGLITYVAPPVDKYYKFLSTNSDDPVTGKWREYKGGSSGGNTGAIGESWTTNIDCGGIAANTSIDSDMTVVEFLKALTVAYLKPVIDSFIGSAQVLNCKGDTISGVTLTATVTKKSEPIANVKFLRDGSVIQTDSSKPTGGTYSYAYGANITTDTTFKLEVDDGKSTVFKLLEYKFVDPIYYGMTSIVSPTETDITSLTKLVAEKENVTLSFTAVNQRATFAYPASYGDLVKITDQNTFDNTSGFTKSTATVNGVPYIVYQSGAATLNGFKYSFKFNL